ncbi:MAG TPA: type II toxin-antitoxin system PemK/MazF family toxin [Planctomycetota bacterium]|nr:type II toxin-antitoxin system PemK/MazF family toxin [Planctomycetota bacterium]
MLRSGQTTRLAARRNCDQARLCASSRRWRIQVALPPRHKLKGAILADQLKSLDWRAREAEFFCTVPDAVMAEVLGKIAALTS